MARSSMTIPPPSKPFPFLALPLELREQIYSLYFNPFDRIRPARLDSDDYGGGQYEFDFRILRVCKTILGEATEVWRRENCFIQIKTPWPQTAHYVTQEATLPIVCANDSASRFKHYHETVAVSAPLHNIDAQHSIIILADDLPKFCQVWYYSVLNNQGQMNQHLRLDFTLQDPYYPADPKPIPLPLQKKLLMPFGVIRGLYEVEVEGFHPSLKDELAVQMAIPYDTVQKCCEDCTSHLEEGDRLLAANQALDAITAYTKAHHAIHILVDGRTRRVQADQFFDDLINEGRYKGQVGTTVRIFLRIALVSRMVSSYLKLSLPEEAAFWGWRSINLMREAMGTEFEEFFTDFVSATDMGLLYARTGIAVHKLKERESIEWKDVYEELECVDRLASFEGLIEVAARYLKGGLREVLVKELKEYGLRFEEGGGKGEGDVDSLAPMHRAAAEEEAEVELDMETVYLALPEAAGSGIWH